MSLYDCVYYLVGKSLQLLCILTFGILCLSVMMMMFSKDSIGSVYVGGYCGLSESGLSDLDKLCPVGFLVVCECSGLLQSIRVCT